MGVSDQDLNEDEWVFWMVLSILQDFTSLYTRSQSSRVPAPHDNTDFLKTFMSDAFKPRGVILLQQDEQHQ